MQIIAIIILVLVVLVVVGAYGGVFVREAAEDSKGCAGEIVEQAFGCLLPFIPIIALGLLLLLIAAALGAFNQ